MQRNNRAKRKKADDEIKFIWDQYDYLRVFNAEIDLEEHSFSLELNSNNFYLWQMPGSIYTFVVNKNSNTYVQGFQSYYNVMLQAEAERQTKRFKTEFSGTENETDFNRSLPAVSEQAFRLLNEGPNQPVRVYTIHNLPPTTAYFEPFDTEAHILSEEKKQSEITHSSNLLLAGEKEILPVSENEIEEKSKDKSKAKGKEKVRHQENEKEKETKKKLVIRKSSYNLADKNDVKDLEEAAAFQYIAGENDRLDLITIKPVARLSSSDHIQFGAFATTTIAKGERLCAYLGQKRQRSDLRIANDYYLFNINENECIDARKIGNVGRFLNDACSYNAEYYLDGDQIAIRAIKAISKGDQLLVRYGVNYNFAAYCFLHPTDNNQSSKNLRSQNAKHYGKFRLNDCPYDLEPLGISKSTSLVYAPKPIIDLLKKKDLSRLDPEYPMHLPILELNTRREFSAFKNQERITALMFAAYVGNANAIHTLFNAHKSPYAEMQQSNSGRTALHLLFLGAKIDTTSQMRKAREDALKEFFKLRTIKNILTIKDKDGKTPLFAAIDHAPPSLLQKVMEIKKLSIADLLISRTDNGLDLLLYAIAEKKYEHAVILLNAILAGYPDLHVYFQTLQPASRGIIRLLIANLNSMQEAASDKSKMYSPLFFAQQPNLKLSEKQNEFISALTAKLASYGALYPRQPQVNVQDLKLSG